MRPKRNATQKDAPFEEQAGINKSRLPWRQGRRFLFYTGVSVSSGTSFTKVWERNSEALAQAGPTSS